MSSSAQEPQGDAPVSLMPLITGYMPSRVVHVSAQLGIADLLADGPKTADALARETNTHAASLRRLLRALASIGLLEEIEPGRFSLTATGAQLRSNVPGSMRNLALMFGGERAWRSWGELLHSVRTGESATRHVFGVGSFEYLAANPEQAGIFNEAMAEITRQVTQALISNCDFSQFRTLVDVGGGNGAMMAALVGATPDLRGVVFDLPSGSAEASRKLADARLDDRCEVVAGDFFREVPKGADAYILKSVIHDWDDDSSIAILTNCRIAMHENSRLLLVERVMPEVMERSLNQQRMAMIDINMLAMPGGQERTELEYRVLLASAGFVLTQIKPLPGLDFSLIEAAPQ
jgi:orsellinic acid C2-O-methyltransferase